MQTGDIKMDPNERMPERVARDLDEQARGERWGGVSVFTCPECGGALWQVDEAQPLRLRCHVGHAYNGEVLLAEQSETREAAMWTAILTFREKSILSRQLANGERRAGQVESAERFDERAAQSERYASLIQSLLLNGQVGGGESVVSPGQSGFATGMGASS
jgi:two-component system chemotaxis response regulator CheB